MFRNFLMCKYDKKAKVLDVRSPERAKSGQKLYGPENWMNIPLSQIPERYTEVPDEEDVYVYCNTGTTAYEAQNYLRAMGKKNVKSVQGSYVVVKSLQPDFDPENPDQI